MYVQYCVSFPLFRFFDRRITHSFSAMENASVDEGKAHVIQPPAVFYNPVQEFNRDLTIAVLTEFAKDHFAQQERAILKKKSRAENAITSVDEDKTDKSEAKVLGSGIVHQNGLTIFEGLSASGLRYNRLPLVCLVFFAAVAVTCCHA